MQGSNSHPRGATRVVTVHPPLVQVWHWLNVIAIFIMVGSGWHIYNNVPVIPWLTFPDWATLGGEPELTYKLHGDVGFGNALLWHFATMWLLVVNGVVYGVYGLASGRFRRKLLPISASGIVADVRDALTFKLAHEDISVYNSVQKLLYVGILCVLVLIVLSGLAVWKPVQLQSLAALFGGFQGARLVHFLCMSAIVAFVVVHVTLALLVPSTLRAMVTGRARVPVAAMPAAAAAALVTPAPPGPGRE
jgi:thiosulfate reductase cytochrome b subunit